MKGLISRTVFLTLLSLSFFSCLKDKGNYEYSEINEVKVSGIDTTNVYEVFAFVDTLKIFPEIEGTKPDNGRARYTYEWKLIDAAIGGTTDGTEEYVVGRDKNLQLPVTLDAKDYAGFYNVTDQIEGTTWGVEFRVRVRTLTKEGFMVLCEVNGQGRLDMLINTSATEYVIARDLWKEESYEMGKPVAVYFNYDLRKSSTLYVAETGTYSLDKNLLAGEKSNFKWQFGSVPNRIDVRATSSTMLSEDGPPRELVVDNEGRLFVRSTSMIGSMFEYPVNFLNGVEFEAAPYIGKPLPNIPAGYSAWGHSFVIYDNTNKQFLELRETAEFPSVISFVNNDLFPTQTGREVVYIGSNLNKYTFAVLSDPATARLYLYGMVIGEVGVNTQEYYLELLRPGTEEITNFSFHPLLPYVFFTTENKIYRFNYSQPELMAEEVMEYHDAQIQTIKFTPVVGWNPYQTWERDRANLLVVSTNKTDVDETECGVIEFFEAPPLNKPLIRKKEITGFGKIVDVTFRER